MAREPARARTTTTTTKRKRVTTPKVVERETPQAAAKRALANLNAAEARRGKVVAPVEMRHDPELRKGGETKRTGGKGGKASVTDQLEFDLDAALADLNADYIECRDIGHPWRKASTRWLDASNAWEQTMVCARCGTERTRWLSRTGALIGGGYSYADGYQIKGCGRLTGTDRDKVRLVSILADTNVRNLNAG